MAVSLRKLRKQLFFLILNEIYFLLKERNIFSKRITEDKDFFHKNNKCLNLITKMTADILKRNIA